MKNIYKHIFTTALLGLVLGSCDFGDTNVDPNSLDQGKVGLNLILPKAQVQSAFNLGAESGRAAGIWMQYFDGLEAQQNDIANYGVTESDFNNTWTAQLYVGSMKDCITILEKSTAEGSEASHYAGIAKILLAQNLGFATQLWGDIPYSDAFQGSLNLNPTFDSQESIYESIQTLLDEAIVALSAEAVGLEPAGDDLIFGGDASLWVLTARSLKARYYLQTSKRSSSAAADALAAINAGAISALGEQPDFFFGATDNEANPIAQFERDRPGTLGVNPNFYNVYLNGDPRINVYSTNNLKFADDALYWGAYASPMPLISYAEVKFIEAEALLRVNANDVAGAQAALAEAINASMGQVGLNTASATVQNYVTANSNLAALGTLEQRIERIIVEKYKALYVQGMVEIWSDYRRTGYPALTPKAGADVTVIPRRLPYPIDERLTNSAQLEAAVSNQGGASLTDDLWVFGN